MRIHKLTLCAFAAIAALATACSNDELASNNTPKEGIEIEATANTPKNGADTRLTHTDNSTTMDIVWAAGDKFTACASSSNYTDYTIKAEDAGKASAAFTGTWDSAPEAGTIHALYPATTAADLTAITLTLEGQKGTLNDLKDFNYMTASAAYSGTGDLTFGTFAHQVAIVKLVLTFPDGVTGNASNITLKATGLNKSTVLNLTDGTFGSPTAGDIATTEAIAIENHQLTAYLCVFPGALTNVKVVATVDSKDYEAALSDLTIAAGNMYTAALATKFHPTDKFDNEADTNIDGSSWDKAYEIATKEQLTLLATRINNENATWTTNFYKLTADIDFGADNTAVWTPIGNEIAPFLGRFDGGNKAIKGKLTADASVIRFGIFGCTNNAEIKNVRFEGTMDTSKATSLQFLGGIAGNIDYTTITNCSNTADLSSDGKMGGIVGTSQESKVMVCVNSGTITSTSIKIENLAGGIVGGGNGSIIGCINKGLNISSINGATGGITSRGTPIACWSIATTITTTNFYKGAIVGKVLLSAGGVAKSCYWKEISGVLGYAEGSATDLEHFGSADKPTAEQIADMNKAWAEADANREYQFNATTGEIEKK